ncbi:penicillin-insensitive murein endopeptidase [Roseomonas marmotae]|uniref:Penicillin-insensitive murein endopeptidase n=1 Tax=Roseomonas marmotae TaxID=2768161 RepID=A0ABS3KAI6_9PROT|nr:penicillin-insensitive murein endopeptidase [Roseomonas marmotae]MBO1074484.1 penicillin-insensitive murein endopeptidase [Roseomonas marmotae]QTI78216.1 penicillin-insensitive murein endopeptidase [Roseomonas marmotae]
MRLFRVLHCLVLLPLAFPASAADTSAPGWAAAGHPTVEAPRVIGSHGLGCIAGAVAMPPEGPGWEVVRLSRNRFWGHPAMIDTLASLAAAATGAGLPPIWIGDVSQPRGGPMPWGHASHQIGLDADVWLDVAPRPARPRPARERLNVPSLVRPDGQDIDPDVYSPGHEALIRSAAQMPEIDRVLVNPAIKRALCRNHGGEAWLRRIRPWAGHDSHMHLRLRCPRGQAGCQDQAPVPLGDGCDASLEWWFRGEARRPAPARPPRLLPANCAGVLAAP